MGAEDRIVLPMRPGVYHVPLYYQHPAPRELLPSLPPDVVIHLRDEI